MLPGGRLMAEYKLISADSHVSEPPDLWVTRVAKQFRERAPRLVIDPPGLQGAYFLYEGYAPHPIGIGLGAGKSAEELKEFLTKATYVDARPGGWDPVERIKDNALDGVEADVLYTTLALYDARLPHLLAARSSAAGRVLSRLQRLAGRVLPPRARPHGGPCADPALRPARRSARTRTRCQDGAERRDDLVLAAT